MTTGSSPPWFLEPHKRDSFRLDETVTLDCVIAGDPRPDIEWLKDGSLLTDSDRIHITYDSTGKCTLAINNFDESFDVGIYSLNAFNDLGEARLKWGIMISEDEDSVTAGDDEKKKMVDTVPFPGVFVVRDFRLYEHQVCKIGADAVFRCITQCTVPYAIQWFKGKQYINSDGMKFSIDDLAKDARQFDRLSTLTIKNLQESDSGVYGAEIRVESDKYTGCNSFVKLLVTDDEDVKLDDDYEIPDSELEYPDDSDEEREDD